jgi:mono/diheme cytochrome c family protein
MKVILSCISFLLIFGFLVVSCSARRVEKEWTTSEADDPLTKKGRLIFKNNCQRCHPNGEAGAGPPLNSIRLPGFLIKARVRSRAFLLWAGRMPAFDKHEISRSELQSLIHFMKVMERPGKK